jgi:hypothetical protein
MQRLHFSPAPISAQLISAATLKVRQRVAVQGLKQIVFKALGVAGAIDRDLAASRPALLLRKYL